MVHAKMIKLIIFDLYGTLVRVDSVPQQRAGLIDFLEKNKNKIIIVFTDDYDKERVKKLLKENGIIKYIKKIYYFKDIDKDDCKNLGKVCKDFNVKKQEAVFIGDNLVGRDLRSTQKYNIKFIQVPTFGYNTSFSFDSIDLENIKK